MKASPSPTQTFWRSRTTPPRSFERKSLQKRFTTKWRQRWPVVNAQISFSLGDSFGSTSLSETDVVGGISFDLPILSLRGGAIAKARAQGTVADATLKLDTRKTLSEVRDAYHSLQAAAGRARALRSEVLPAMLETAAMTEDSYREGRADLVRLLEAERAVVETNLAEVEAISTFGKAVADLERAVGRKLDAR